MNYLLHRQGMICDASGMAATRTSPEYEIASTEERMLLQVRDGLYEGDWDDFVYDLTARLEGQPHVFQTVSASADMKATITRHLEIIARLRRAPVP